MEIARSDKIKKKLLEEICARKKQMGVNLRTLRARRSENDMLAGVVADYEKYHAFILAEKERKEKTFKGIIEYLDRIMEEGKLTDSGLRETKYEQDRLIESLGSIRGQLDELMEITRET